MKQFEYKTIYWGEKLEDDSLNKDGKDGWELISVTQDRNFYTYIFKRERKGK